MNVLSQPIRGAPAKVGGIFDDLIHAFQVGVGAYGQINQQGGGGQQGAAAPCSSAHMSDSGLIAGCIDHLASQYHQLEAAGASVNDLLQAATAILAELNNDQRFAQNSNDPYLAQAKAVMAHTIQVLRSQGAVTTATGGGATTTVTTIGANGQPVTTVVPVAGSAPLISGIPNQYLLIGAAGLVGAYLLLKR